MLNKHKILILANEYTTIINFRMELIEALIHKEYEIYVSLPDHERNEEIERLGAHIISTQFKRKGKNPFSDLKLLLTYKRMIKRISPDFVLTFTIKPNIYGGMACRKLKVPQIANITGLGVAVENKGTLQKLTVFLYRKGLKKAKMIFFQNRENADFMLKKKIVKGNYDILPGSGVNLTKYKLIDYRKDDIVNFVYVARVMKEKGIDQYLEAARAIKVKYPDTAFHVCGPCSKDYDRIIKKLSDENLIVYHGVVSDMNTIYSFSHCTVLPTFYPEGLSNVLLESAACGKPIIATDRAGCREIIDDGVNGFVVKQKDSADLILKMEAFLSLSWEERREMGLNGRKKVEENFDRNIVVNAYLTNIK